VGECGGLGDWCVVLITVVVVEHADQSLGLMGNRKVPLPAKPSHPNQPLVPNLPPAHTAQPVIDRRMCSSATPQQSHAHHLCMPSASASASSASASASYRTILSINDRCIPYLYTPISIYHTFLSCSSDFSPNTLIGQLHVSHASLSALTEGCTRRACWSARGSCGPTR
jgi:hypothetical protein